MKSPETLAGVEESWEARETNGWFRLDGDTPSVYFHNPSFPIYDRRPEIHRCCCKDIFARQHLVKWSGFQVFSRMIPHQFSKTLSLFHLQTCFTLDGDSILSGVVLGCLMVVYLCFYVSGILDYDRCLLRLFSLPLGVEVFLYQYQSYSLHPCLFSPTWTGRQMRSLTSQVAECSFRLSFQL